MEQHQTYGNPPSAPSQEVSQPMYGQPYPNSYVYPQIPQNYQPPPYQSLPPSNTYPNPPTVVYVVQQPNVIHLK